MKMKTTNFISIVNTLLVIGILSYSLVSASPLRNFPRQAPTGQWDIVGDSKVAAMHIVPVSYNEIVIIDKLEVNKIKQANGNPAISAVYNIDTNEVRALNLNTDTFCTAGSFFGNGTLLHAGGAEQGLGYAPGYQSIRFLTPSEPNFDWTDIPNGNALVLGGSLKGTGKNNAAINNPSFEIWAMGAPTPPAVAPPQPTPLQFLVDSMPYNLYPFLTVLPNFNDQIIAFIFANNRGIVYDFATNTVVRDIPVLPGGIRSYPLTGNSILLPLRPSKNYKPVIMICGGNTVQEIKSPAIASCGRIDPTLANDQWEMDDFGGTGRVMPDSVLLPTGQVLYVNGGGTGFAGYHTGPKTNPLYVSDNPVLTPFIYDPETKAWTTNLAPSTVPRLYHSVATLVSDGRVFVTGSNPQGSVEVGTKFPTEYRVEMFTPPYLQTGLERPVINSVAGFTTLNTERVTVTYGQQIEVKVKTGQTQSFLTAAVIHHGFTTHSQSFSRRYVMCNVISSTYDPGTPNDITLVVEMPPNPTILPPGPSYLYILDNNVPATYAVALTLSNAA